MGGPGFDLNDNDFLFPIDDHTAIDSDGDVHMRVGDHMSMDMNDGSMHGIVGWDDPDTYYDSETEDRYEDLVGGPVYYEERSGGCVLFAAILFGLAVFGFIAFLVWIFV